MMDQVTPPRTPKDNGAIDSEESASTHASSQILANNDKEGFGDFVSTDYEEFELEEVVEPWDKYDPKSTPNVFYPICLGEVLNERCLIEHKIDAGGFSTVWIALDLQTNKDVAVKVLSTGDCGDIELHIQDEIIRTVQDRSHRVTYSDTFLLNGNDCHHRVMVFPLMGPCLDRYTVMKFALSTRMSAAKQLVEALETLHNAGILHRDLNERNCMWGMAPLQNLSRSAEYEALTRPLKQTIPAVEQWKGSYVFADGFDSWYDRNQTPDTKRTLASELARYRPDADPAVRELVLSIMQKVFIYSPEKRLTATQLLADPSFKALMARFGR